MLDESHERLLCFDAQGNIIYEISNPVDDKEQLLYIDDFCVADSGEVYVQASCWDGMHLSEEMILKYDAEGQKKETLRQWDYSSQWVYKHRVYALSLTDSGLFYVVLQGDAITFLDGEMKYNDAETRISDCVYDDGHLYILDKNGIIYEKENIHSDAELTQIFDVNSSDYADGMPYKLGISSDGTLFYTDIRNCVVMALQKTAAGQKEKVQITQKADQKEQTKEEKTSENQPKATAVVKDTDTLTVFLAQSNEETQILTADAQKAAIYNMQGEQIETIQQLNVETLRCVLWGISIFFVAAGVLGIIGSFVLEIIVRRYMQSLSTVQKLGIVIGIMLLFVAITVAAMLVRQFRSNYKEKVEEQLRIAAYAVASQLEGEDVTTIQKASDYDGETYKNVSEIMEETLPLNIDFYKNIYCNILLMDDEGKAFAVAYLDQSIGDYFPLDEEETQEVKTVYETGQEVWNKEKDDIGGSYIYIKVPVTDKSGAVTCVVAVGTETTVLNNMLQTIINNVLSILVVLVLLLCILFEQILNFTENLRKFNEEEKKEKDKFPHHWMRLIIFGVFAAYNMTAAFLPIYLMKYVEKVQFKDTELAASLPITVNIFIIGATSLVCLQMTTKLGIKKTAILSGISSFLGNALIFIAPSYYVIVVGLVLDGMGVGFMTNAVYILISLIKDSHDRMEGLTVYNEAYLSGINFGVMIGSLFAVQFGQRMVFACVSAVWVLLAIAIILCGNILEQHIIVENTETDEEMAGESKKVIRRKRVNSQKKQRKRWAMWRFLCDKTVNSFIILIQNPYIVFGSFVFYYVPLFCDNRGYSELASTLLLLLYAEIPVFLGSWMTHFIVKKMGYYAMYVAYGCNILALILFALYPQLLGMILALLIMGISACFGKAVQQDYFLELPAVKEYGKGRSIGVYNFTENIGESLGPVVFARLMLYTPLLGAVVPFCAVITALGGLHFFFMRKSVKKSQNM